MQAFFVCETERLNEPCGSPAGQCCHFLPWNGKMVCFGLSQTQYGKVGQVVKCFAARNRPMPGRLFLPGRQSHCFQKHWMNSSLTFSFNFVHLRLYCIFYAFERLSQLRRDMSLWEKVCKSRCVCLFVCTLWRCLVRAYGWLEEWWGHCRWSSSIQIRFGSFLKKANSKYFQLCEFTQLNHN